MNQIITLLLVVAIVAPVRVALSQEFEPYPNAHITMDQWRTYYAEVAKKYHSHSVDLPKEHLVVFFNDPEYTLYAFTTPGHAAYPAWISQRGVGVDGRIDAQQIGYFAGLEEPFAKLFQDYADLIDKRRQWMMDHGDK
jgi:hypothetical protein